jgi:hypothetical protein
VHAVDLVVALAAVVVVILCVAILARQRYMLHTAGAIPLAIRLRGNRWLYGIARYVGGELRWYRALGIGTRPSRVLQRSQLQVVGRRAPDPSELGSLPATAIIVECTDGTAVTILALSESAFTGFVSWLEASAPMS